MNKIYSFYSSIKEKPVEWLWYPYIPYGKITLVQGDPGEGKSTFILNVASILTKGHFMPDGYDTKNPQTVVYQCSEDNLSDTIKPRLVNAGADCNKIAYIINDDCSLNLEDSRIENTIKETNAKLFILDPIQSFLVQESDMQQVGRIRKCLNKLSMLATKYNCAIVLIGHMNKSAGLSNSLYRSLGSVDITAISRSVLMVEPIKKNSQIKCVSHIKSSLAPKGKDIVFSFDNKTGFKWETKAKYNKCNNINNDMLELFEHGTNSSIKIIETLKSKGYSKRSIYTAKDDLNIESYRSGGSWYWKLPEDLFEDKAGVFVDG